MISDRPNIFEFAKKEFSQDAMVCWLLKCLDSEDAEYRQIGAEFLRLIFEGTGIVPDGAKLDPHTPTTQKSHMDVYAVIAIGNKLYPLIFENKTHTYLHGNQIEQYTKAVAKWMTPHQDGKTNDIDRLSERMGLAGDITWGEIIFVYFKTGFPFGWQKDDLKNQQAVAKEAVREQNAGVLFRDIYLADMVEFLNRQPDDPLLADYRSALGALLDKRRSAEQCCLDSAESCRRALSDETGSNEAATGRLFAECFGEKVWFEYSHQQWASRDLVTTHSGKNTIYYGFRFEGGAFRFYQYRYEKDTQGDKEKLRQDRNTEADKVEALCREIIGELLPMQVEVSDFKSRNDSDKYRNHQELFRVSIMDENSPQKVCTWIREFSKCFCRRAGEFGGEVPDAVRHLASA